MHSENISKYRFVVEKNACSFLEKNPSLLPKEVESLTLQNNHFSFSYSGDEEFRKYEYIPLQKIKEIVSFYPHYECFLKNIYWDKVFENATFLLKKIQFHDTFIKHIKRNPSVLSIVQTDSLSGSVLASLLKGMGFSNTIVHFTYPPNINSDDKTFEACLYLFVYETCSFFLKKIEKTLHGMQKNTDIQKEYAYFLITQNNLPPPYHLQKIDTYIKDQIQWKQPKTIYRLDLYPDTYFLQKKNIKTVLFFDCDNDPGKIIEQYKKQIQEAPISFFSETIPNQINGSIGYYESYLEKKSEEYFSYRESFIESVSRLHPKAKRISTSQTNQTNSENSYNKEIYITFIILILVFVIIPLIVIRTSESEEYHYVGSGSSGGSIFWGGGGSSSNESYKESYKQAKNNATTKQSSPKTIIRSFGGGGFMKGMS